MADLSAAVREVDDDDEEEGEEGEEEDFSRSMKDAMKVESRVLVRHEKTVGLGKKERRTSLAQLEQFTFSNTTDTRTHNYTQR